MNWTVKKIFLRSYDKEDKEKILETYSMEKWKSVIDRIKIERPKSKITTLSLKLANKLNKEFDFEVFPIIIKTNAGYWQKSAGAWLWYMYTQEGMIGSQYTAYECSLNKTKLEATGNYFEVHIDVI